MERTAFREISSRLTARLQDADKLARAPSNDDEKISAGIPVTDLGVAARRSRPSRGRRKISSTRNALCSTAFRSVFSFTGTAISSTPIPPSSTGPDTRRCRISRKPAVSIRCSSRRTRRAARRRAGNRCASPIRPASARRSTRACSQFPMTARPRWRSCSSRHPTMRRPRPRSGRRNRTRRTQEHPRHRSRRRPDHRPRRHCPAGQCARRGDFRRRAERARRHGLLRPVRARQRAHRARLFRLADAPGRTENVERRPRRDRQIAARRIDFAAHDDGPHRRGRSRNSARSFATSRPGRNRRKTCSTPSARRRKPRPRNPNSSPRSATRCARRSMPSSASRK